MRVVQGDLWFCVDCLFVAVNGDDSGIESEERLAEVEEGLAALGPHLVPDFDSETDDGILEFSRCGCDCCGSPLAGTMHRFAVLGEGEDDQEYGPPVEAATEGNQVGSTES